MSVYLRGKVWWASVKLKGMSKAERVSTGETDKELAEQFERKLRVSLEDGTYVSRRKTVKRTAIAGMTLKEMLDRWAREVGKTSRFHTEMQQKLINSLGANFPVEAITDEVVAKMRGEWLTKGNSANTINKALNSLRNAMDQAEVVWKMKLPNMPRFSRYRMKNANKVMTFFISEEEEQKIFEFCREQDKSPDTQLPWLAFIDMIIVSTEAGLRPGETLQLRKIDVDFEHYRLHIRSWGREQSLKTEHHGTADAAAPMTDRCREVLWKRRDKLHVFDDINGVSQARNMWRKVKDFMGYESGIGADLRAFRRTSGSRLTLTGNVSQKDVSLWLRQKDPNSAKHYMHLADGRLDTLRGMVENKKSVHQMCDPNPGCEPNVSNQVGEDSVVSSCNTSSCKQSTNSKSGVGLHGVQVVGGSNPLAPTRLLKEEQEVTLDTSDENDISKD